jgi:tetratricopeptide (TPR) repeat protein
MNSMSAKRAADFAALARQLADERSNAADRLTELLRTTPRDEWHRLAENPELHNNGALERLSKEVHTAIDRQPQDALDLSALGVSIAETLHDEQYPAVVLAQARAHAWKDRSQALAFNGKHEEALAAIHNAENILSTFGTLAHDRALVLLAKASALQLMGRYDEALPLLTEARGVFDSYGDQKLVVQSGITEGALLYRQRRFEAAYAVFDDLLKAELRDRSSLAAIHNNIAFCLIELGNLTAANVHLSEAITHFNDLGNRSDALRSEFAVGRLLAAKGRTSDALIRLRVTQKKFAEMGLVQEAAICGLDITATLLVERREAEARQMFESIRPDLAGGNERARTALAYLSDQFAAHDATPAVVRHITEYIESLRSQPTLEFTALS